MQQRRINQMHSNQIATDAALVRRLLEKQFPQWALLPIEPVVSDGTSNAIYRLGDDMAVRLPLQPGAATIAQIDKEHRWLPALAGQLPLSIPLPIARGMPTEYYRCQWTVCQWLEGKNPTLENLADPVKAATDLAAFIHALQRIDPAEGPPPGAHNFHRGVPLAERDSMTRAALEQLHGVIDTDAAAAAWQRDMNADPWQKPPVWIHGDLAPGNLLSVDGRLSGVIDWGGLGVGDPATDLLPAWNLFDGPSREAFRRAMSVDDATWARGRGLALSVALVALPYYLHSNPAIVRWARGMIERLKAKG